MSRENYESVLADLQARRDQIDAAIQAIMLMMGAPAGMTNGSTPGSQRIAAPQDVPPGEFLRLSIVDATKKYLDMVKSKQPIPQIMKALEQGGLPPSKYNTVYAVLRRREAQVGDIRRMGDDWGLTEWYPNSPNLKKRPEPAKKSHKKGRKTQGKTATLKATKPPTTSAPASMETDKDTQAGKEMTLCDAAEQVLIDSSGAMHVKLILAKLADLGKTATKDTLARGLMKDTKKRFAKVGPNVFDLTQRQATTAASL